MVNKALGQHWLNNRAILDQIARLARGEEGTACPPDTLRAALAKSSCSVEHIVPSSPLVVEIGPGLGTLTSSLLRRFDKVIAVEYDKDLARKLPGSFPGKNLEVVNEDFLRYDLSKVPTPYVVAGNIPYYITSPIITKLLEAKNRPERVVLLIQKEVAERIVDERETLLSLRCKNWADAKLGPVVLRNEFTPPPKVDSQVIVLEPHDPLVSSEVFDLIEAGFKQPRKKATHNLATYISREDIKDIFTELGLNVDARPGDLHLEDWQRIYEKIKQFARKK